jgi:excisionase family DNA binding protein
MEQLLLTPEEAGSLVGLSGTYFRQHATRKEPRIKSYRLGSKIRFKREDVLAFVESENKKDGK